MIGKRVRQLRIEKGFSLTQLAEKANVAKSYLSSIEREIQSNPSIQFLEKIAQVFEMSVEELLNDPPKTASNSNDLDKEWQELLIEAMNSGVSKDEFKEFLEYNKWKNNPK